MKKIKLGSQLEHSEFGAPLNVTYREEIDLNSSSKLTFKKKQRTVGHTIWIIQLIKCIKVFALSAALLGARFRSSDAGLLGGIGVNVGNDDDGNTDFEVPAGVNLGRRRSRAVLYQLSGHYKPEKIKTKLKLNNVRNYFRLYKSSDFHNKSIIFNLIFCFVCRTYFIQRMLRCPSTKHKHWKNHVLYCRIMECSKDAGIGWFW